MKNKFDINEKVYHITKGSPEGIVLEARQYLSDGSWEYLIVWGHNNKTFCVEEELSKTRS